LIARKDFELLCFLILITLSVPDEGNFDYIERTWWRLSQ